MNEIKLSRAYFEKNWPILKDKKINFRELYILAAEYIKYTECIELINTPERMN